MRASWPGVQMLEPPLHASPAAEFTSATLPSLALMAVVPVASGVGRTAPVAPEACCTRKYCPGCRFPDSAVTFAENRPVPAALAYCRVIPVNDTTLEPRLNSST